MTELVCVMDVRVENEAVKFPLREFFGLANGRCAVETSLDLFCEAKLTRVGRYCIGAMLVENGVR